MAHLRAKILDVLKDGPNFGLGIMDTLFARGERKGLNTIYTELRGMEREGLVESYPDDRASEVRGGRPRTYYRLKSV
jgi:DNA-binding PadR family transcriptional regulator